VPPGPIHPCRRSNNKIYSQVEETDSHLTTCRHPPLLMIRPSGICINSAKVPVHLFPITSTQNNIKSRRTESLHTKRDSHLFCFCLPAWFTCSNERVTKSDLQIEETDSHLTTCRYPPLLIMTSSRSASIRRQLFHINSTRKEIESRRTKICSYRKETLTFLASASRHDSPVQTSE
jgi:hypothetical protein